MEKYEELIKYIAYFEDDRNTFCTWESPKEKEDGVFIMPYPIYDEKLEEFIEDVYNTDLLKHDYLEFIEKNIEMNANIIDVIERADFETLRAILTKYIRLERFCEGTWGAAAKEGTFLKILKKIKQSTKEKR